MHLAEVGLEIVGMGQLLERGREQFLLGCRDAAERVVDADEAPVGRDQRLADRRLVEGVAEALLGVAQLARRLALGGDVAADPQVTGEHALGVADRRDRERHGQLRAVAAHECPVARVRVLGARAVSQHAADRHAELEREALELLAVVKEVGVMAADEVLRAIAEHPLGAAVEDRDEAVGVGADDRVLRRRVEHGLEVVAGRDRGASLARRVSSAVAAR